MKMTPNLDDPTRPINKFSFFHSTLQEYLSALYMSLGLHLPDEQNTSIVWRTLNRLWTYICSYFWYTFPDIPLVLHKHSALLRFLAGLCKHNSKLCEQVGNLVVSDHLQLVQCLDESDSLLENRAIQKLFNSDKAISIKGGVPFDYYLVGHCFRHHSGMWDIEFDKKQKIDLLIQSLETFKCRGKVVRLSLTNLDFLSLEPLLPLLSNLQQLYFRQITFKASSASVLKRYMSPKLLKTVGIYHCEHVEKLLPIVFGPSSIDTLDIVDEDIVHISDHVRKLLKKNSNLEHLRLHFPLKLPAHTLCDNTSVDFLAKWMRTFKSYSPKIKTLDKSSKYDVMFYFEKTSADDTKPKIEFQKQFHVSCNPSIRQRISALQKIYS